ncbi:MAG: TatD family hydrolase [Tannerella sp.]|jgi:TatD DNase family protein|nr:TatD family hydrolase [Tannerella sp.]
MIYCDIHTHQPPANPEDLAVIAADIRQPFPLRSGRYAVGIHPWHADKEALPLLRTLATHSQVAAIGEAGLDKLASISLSLQEEVFTAQARLAGEVGKPLIIHCVKAWPELIAIRQTVRSDIPWIIHGFRGNDKLAGQLLRFGFYLSFGIHCQSEAVRMAWKARRLFAETDNENVDIREVYSSIAVRLSISEEILSQAILENFRMIQLYTENAPSKTKPD